VCATVIILAAKRLPCHRVGRKMRFKRDEVEDWMESYGRKR
jgi:excisionase family DNA binding protein